VKKLVLGIVIGFLLAVIVLNLFSNCEESIFDAGWVEASAGNEPPDLHDSGGQSTLELPPSPTPTPSPSNGAQQ
jgi:hypothetical protein